MAVTPVRTASTLALRGNFWILTPSNPEKLWKITIPMTQCKIDNAHILLRYPDNSVVDRYSTVTRPLPDRYVRYTPEDTQALGIPAFWGGVKC